LIEALARVMAWSSVCPSTRRCSDGTARTTIVSCCSHPWVRASLTIKLVSLRPYSLRAAGSVRLRCRPGHVPLDR
jgi:hypothetical protein